MLILNPIPLYTHALFEYQDCVRITAVELNSFIPEHISHPSKTKFELSSIAYKAL